MKKLLPILYIMCVPQLVSAGGDVYVATTGSDNGSCGAIGSPCATVDYTISNRITDALGGWHVYLREGTYYECNIFFPAAVTGVEGNWNTLQSYPGEWAKIDGQRTCSGPVYAVITNSNSSNYHSGSYSFAEYWTFERLEITGGGMTDTTDAVAAGIMWTKGPGVLRYSYIHDNLNGHGDGLPAGLYINSGQGWTIQYNWFEDNGSDTDPSANCANITMGPNAPEYVGIPEAYNSDWWLMQNEISYNYLVSDDVDTVAIRTKTNQFLTSDRTGATTTNVDYGDKIHHNIAVVKGGSAFPVIFYQQDYVQIYKNIVDQENAERSYGMPQNWPIMTRRWGSVGNLDQVWPVLYNNTVYYGGAEFGALHESDGSAPDTIWMYNNILDNSRATWAPMTFGCSPSWCLNYSDTAAMSLTNVNIDANYFYRIPGSYDIYIGNYDAHSTPPYTVSGFNSAKGGEVVNYSNLYNDGDLLYQGSTGSAKYITRGDHSVGSGVTIADGGVNILHPYLDGITIPDYLGATDPDDIITNDWVAGVLNLNVAYFTSATNGSEPLWIEGGSSPSVITCYKDQDGDDYGDENSPSESIETCSANYYESSDLIEVNSDCDDSDANINPGATDFPGNRIDEDCSGSDTITTISFIHLLLLF